MRRLFDWSLMAAGMVALSSPVAVSATVAVSASDRARIALLVYQSQSARQADLRRGDALTRALRVKAEGAEKTASVTRVELLKALAEGANAKKRALDLKQQLEKQEQALAETAQQYSVELARRDEDYARERSVLISTGERLLTTAEGRRVLDLYNAGGEANWKEAKAVLDEARRVRRALDTRDAAVMYAQARAKGLETTASVIAVYEDLLRDDPSQANDWYFLSILYRESGAGPKALNAAEMAARLAIGDFAETRALVEVGRAQRANGDIQGALTTLQRAETAARAGVADKSGSASRVRLLADVLTQRGSILLDNGAWPSARSAFIEAIQRYEKLLPGSKDWSVKEMYLGALLGLAHSYWNEEDVADAAPIIEKAQAFATTALKLHPGITEAREKAALTSAWSGDLSLSQWKYEAALRNYEQAAATYKLLTSEDPGLTWYDPNVEYLDRAIGSAEFELNRPKTALDHLKQSERIARKYKSAFYQVALQSGLRRQAIASAALGNMKDAENQWNEALQVGRPLLEQDSTGPGGWARIEQSTILLDLANEALSSHNFERGLSLVSETEPLLLPLRKNLPVASRAVGMTAARLKAELTFASGDAARSTQIYEDALRESGSLAGSPGARIELRFGRADLLLSSSKQRMALNDRPTAIAQLRQAHEILRQIASECDSAEVHRKLAESIWLKAKEGIDEVSWAMVADRFQQLKDHGYSNDNSEQLFAQARANLDRAAHKSQ